MLGPAPELEGSLADMAQDSPADLPAPPPDVPEQMHPSDSPPELPDVPQDLPDPVEEMGADMPDDMPVDEGPPWMSTPLVSAQVTASCTTESVKGLSLQLIEEINCLQPGLMESVASAPELSFYSAVFPYFQAPAAQALRRVVAGQAMMTISSALRTIPQQYLLYRWYQLGRCSIGLAAAPGRSNHNGGLALDTPDYSGWRARLESDGWRWLGSNDVVHFDYTSSGQDVRAVSVRAFQRLWNRNNPADLIAEDGVYGPQTEARLTRSPSGGFRLGAMCAMSALHQRRPDADSLDDLDLSASLAPEGQGAWQVQVVAPREVWLVSLRVGDEIVATVSRDEAGAGALVASMQLPDEATLWVEAFDREGRRLGLGQAQLRPDAIVWPMGLGRVGVEARGAALEARGLLVSLEGVPVEEISQAPLRAHPLRWELSLRGQRLALERLAITRVD